MSTQRILTTPRPSPGQEWSYDHNTITTLSQSPAYPRMYYNIIHISYLNPCLFCPLLNMGEMVPLIVIDQEVKFDVCEEGS